MTGKYAVGRREKLFPIKDEKGLNTCLNVAALQNNDIVYELVPVGFVASGIFRKAPDATAEVLAQWDGKRVAPAPPEAPNAPIEKHEPLYKRRAL